MPNAYVVLLVASLVHGTAFMVAGGALILVGSTWPSARDGVRVRGMGIDRRDGLESSP